jgi:probable phosphoglycerate mutase
VTSRSLYVALIRHAPTTWNLEGRAQGRADPPVSPEGYARLARWRLPADLAHLAAGGRLGWATSPLRRAIETAQVLGAEHPLVEPRLAERDYGEWTGRALDELDTAGEGGTDPGWDHRPPGGESPAEVLRRSRAWLDELAAGDGPETWIAVTHRGLIRSLIAAAIGWDLRAPEPLRLLPERLHRIRRRGDGLLQLVTLNEPLAPLEP